MKKEYMIKAMRHIRGDGNCYYRSVYFEYFEMVIMTGESSLKALIEL